MRCVHTFSLPSSHRRCSRSSRKLADARNYNCSRIYREWSEDVEYEKKRRRRTTKGGRATSMKDRQERGRRSHYYYSRWRRDQIDGINSDVSRITQYPPTQRRGRRAGKRSGSETKSPIKETQQRQDGKKWGREGAPGTKRERGRERKCSQKRRYKKENERKWKKRKEKKRKEKRDEEKIIVEVTMGSNYLCLGNPAVQWWFH